jgi:hypothetical protein
LSPSSEKRSKETSMKQTDSRVCSALGWLWICHSSSHEEFYLEGYHAV